MNLSATEVLDESIDADSETSDPVPEVNSDAEVYSESEAPNPVVEINSEAATDSDPEQENVSVRVYACLHGPRRNLRPPTKLTYDAMGKPSVVKR